MTIEKREAQPGREVRTLTTSAVEIRAEGEAIRVSGYAAVFDEETNVGGYFREVIRPGAFASALKRGDDVPFLINHDGLPLSRTSSKTLTLSQDSRGLKMETALDGSDPDVMRIVPKMKRGDLTKMSFAFTIQPDGEQRWIQQGGDDAELREIIKVGRLWDVSIVTDPQYTGTEIALRSRDAARETHAPSDARKTADLRRRMNLDLLARKNG